MMRNSPASRVVLVFGAIMFSSLANAHVVTQPGGGLANDGFGSIGNSAAGFDTIRFTPATVNNIANKIVIYLSEDLSFTDPQSNNFYSIWENIEFAGQIQNSERTRASLVGINVYLTSDLSDAFVRDLSTRTLSLTDTDLNTGKIRLGFLGTDNRISLDNSSITIAGDSPGISSLAPMTIDVTAGSNSISNLTKNYNPTSLRLDIASGATLAFIDSGVPLTTVTANRLYFRTPVTGLVDGGTLSFNLSNAYFNTTSDFRFINNAQLSLDGFGTLAEFERLEFANSDISLARNTNLKINNQLKITDTDVFIDYGANFSVGVVKPYGAVNFSSPGTGSQLNIESLLIGDGAAGQLDISGVPQTNIDYLFFLSGAGSSFSVDSNVNISDELYAIGNPQITLLSGANLNLLGASNPVSSQLDLGINAGATFSVGRGGQFAHTSSTAIVNNGDLKIDGDYLVVGSATMSGTGGGNVYDNGRILLRSPQSTLTLSNPLTVGSIIDPLLGGELHTVINVDNGTPQSGTILYGSGDIDITRAKSLNVTQAGSNTASEMDGKAFTVLQAQNNGVAGTLTGAAGITVVEGGNIPALIDFTVIDNNTNGKPDLTLSAAKLPISSLVAHPNRASRNQLASAKFLINAASSNNASISTSLDSLNNAQLATHFDSIHAEPYSSYMTVSLEHSDSVMNTVMNYAAPNDGFSTGTTQEFKDQLTGERFWLDVNYADGNVDGSDDLGDFDYTLSSLTLGQDLMRTGDRALGAYLSIGTQKMDEHDSANQDFNGDTYHLGLYLNEANIGAWDLRGVLGYAFSNHESKRRVNLASSSTLAKADFNSHSAYAGVKGTTIGYKNDWVTLSPELGLSYIYYSQESIKETGDPNLSLNIDSAETHALIASAGLNARFASLSDTMSIYPIAYSRYEHDVYANDNNEHEIDAALVAHPGFKQAFVGQNRGEHAIISGIGLGSDLTSALKINGGFDYSVSNHGSKWGVGFNLEYTW